MHPTFQIIGDAFVDLFAYLENGWPEAGGDAPLSHPIITLAGGSSTNTATHLSCLVSSQVATEKSKVVLHSVMNPQDEYGRLLMNHAAARGYELVNCVNVEATEENAATGHCIAIVSNGERSFMSHSGCVEKFTAEDIKADRFIECDGPLHIHVAGYFNLTAFWDGKLSERLNYIIAERKRRCPNSKTVTSLVVQHDASGLWDGGLEGLIQNLDYLILNEMEASGIARKGCAAGSPDSAAQPSHWISYFSSISTTCCFIVTRGPKGAIAFRNSEVILDIKSSVSVQVIDTTGAGDAFAAGFMYGLWFQDAQVDAKIESSDVDEAIKRGLLLGCATGTAAVQVRGASTALNTEIVHDLLRQQMLLVEHSGR